MSWRDELDEQPVPAPQIQYFVGREPLDVALLVLGSFLMIISIGFDTGQAAIAGVFFLGWTAVRRWLEYRWVTTFNRQEPPVDTLDDLGFLP